MAGRKGMWSRSRWRRLMQTREALEAGCPPVPAVLSMRLGYSHSTAARYLAALGYGPCDIGYAMRCVRAEREGGC